MGREAKQTGNARDVALMLRVRDGDEAALEEIYARYQRPVLNFIFRMVRDRALAEDLTQEVFLRLWRSRGRYEPMALFTTYLFQIARNAALNEIDRRGREPLVSGDGRGGEPGDPEIAASREPPDLHPGPALQADLNETRHIVEEAVAALDEKHRAVFVLGYFQGFRYREIAEILDIPVGTVKSRMAHAEKKVRSRVERRTHAPGPAEGPADERAEGSAGG